jgi:predicted transcriptional regulator
MDHGESKSQINVRVDGELRAQLERLARAEDRPLSSWVRRALRAEAARRSSTEQAAA